MTWAVDVSWGRSAEGQAIRWAVSAACSVAAKADPDAHLIDKGPSARIYR